MSIWLVLALAACAIGAIRSARLVDGAIWLGGTSVVLAALLASMGAVVVAVVELSVGAGLVAVLFVFAIAVAGEQGWRAHPPIRTLVALAVTVPAILLLAWLASWPVSAAAVPAAASATALAWEQRGFDLVGQIVLIVTGALAVRAILGDRASAVSPAATDMDQLDAAPVGSNGSLVAGPPTSPDLPAQPVLTAVLPLSRVRESGAGGEGPTRPGAGREGPLPGGREGHSSEPTVQRREGASV